MLIRRDIHSYSVDCICKLCMASCYYNSTAGLQDTQDVVLHHVVNDRPNGMDFDLWEH